MLDSGVEVVALLGTSFARLEQQGTRWRFLLREWAGDARVRRLVALDFPKISARHLASGELAVPRPSWLEGCELLEARVPLHPSTSLGSALAWSRTARAVNRALGPASRPRVTVAATPLWVPLLGRLEAAARGFDAVDDWRALPGMAHLRSHVAAGYAALPAVTTCTSVSGALAVTLAQDYGVHPEVVPNGVDLRAYAGASPAPHGLPDVPFAVYVGVVQQRFDLDLLDQLTAAGVPVVVAGPAVGEAADRLSRSPARWLGPVDVGLVPGLLKRAHVGLVPHRVDPLTRSMDPMKVLEYLAAGLQVVTTPVARSVASPRVVEAEGAAFVGAVQHAMAAPRAHTPDPAVLARDWSVVAQRVLDVHAVRT